MKSEQFPNVAEDMIFTSEQQQWRQANAASNKLFHLKIETYQSGIENWKQQGYWRSVETMHLNPEQRHCEPGRWGRQQIDLKEQE